MKLGWTEFERVDAQAHLRRCVITGEEGIVFFAEEGFHAKEEGGREGGHGGDGEEEKRRRGEEERLGILAQGEERRKRTGNCGRIPQSQNPWR